MKITGGRLCGGQLRDYGRSRASLAVCCAVSDPPSNERLEENAICRGQSMQALTFFFAFVVVLALIGAAAWLVRRFAGNRLGANPNRGRMPRLAVIDAAAVDGRRRLVLVRRHNIEHLLMIGGPTDIVLEPTIVRAMPARDQIAQRPGVAADPAPRLPPLADSGWNEGDGARPDSRPHGFDQVDPQTPEPPPRPIRPSFADEVPRPMPALAVRRIVPFGSDPPPGRTQQRLGGSPVHR